MVTGGGVARTDVGNLEVRWELVPAMVMPHLVPDMGERTAWYLLLTGDQFAGPGSAAHGPG
jgi:hypothetical protein